MFTLVLFPLKMSVCVYLKGEKTQRSSVSWFSQGCSWARVKPGVLVLNPGLLVSDSEPKDVSHITCSLLGCAVAGHRDQKQSLNSSQESPVQNGVFPNGFLSTVPNVATNIMR